MELVRYEPCLEYFRRRLREGWKCVSLEGYNVVLLSPDGFRRELDLRNDVETLRPNAAGDETTLSRTGAPANWDAVDEAVTDDDDYVWSATYQTWKRDLYSLPASSGSGEINFIKVYFRCIYNAVSRSQQAKASIKSNSTVTDGTAKNLTNAWVTYSQQWSTNPADDEDWEWTDIDALQIGVRLYTGDSEFFAACSQVYVEVDYTLSPAETAYNTKVGLPTSWMWEKCGYDGAEKCPVGSEPSWAWQAPTSGGPNKTPQGGPTSFSWGSE